MPPEQLPAPALPYRVEVYRYGHGEGVPRLTKVYDNRVPGELLTPDEVAVWARLQWLEGEVARLSSALSEKSAPAETANTTGEPVGGTVGDAPTPSPEPLAPVGQHHPNALEPQPDTPDDKRGRAIRALQADPGASNATLAQRAGCSDELVRRLRHQLVAEGTLAGESGPLAPKIGTSQPDGNSIELPTEPPVGAG